MSPPDLLAHHVDGDGEPVLLLNGGMMSWPAWEPVSGVLRERFRLISCDLRGQLQSPGAAPLDLGANVDDLVALLDHLRFERVHVVGTSYGGEIGLHLAGERPGRVRSLVAINVSDVATPAVRDGAAEYPALLRAAEQKGLGPDEKRWLFDRLIRDVFSDEHREQAAAELEARRAVVGRLPDRWFHDLHSILAAVATLDLGGVAPRIACPTLLVVAAFDLVFPPERSEALAAAIPDATTVTHPTSGHALIAEDPAWLAERVLAFLLDQEGRA